MIDQYSRVLSRLERLRRCRRENTWSARCPAHEDREPSLLLWVGRTGCLCARCLAGQGCTWPAIVKALGTDMGDWFPPRDEALAWRRRVLPERKIVATYDYRGETGDLLYQVVRYQPKDFRQRRPLGGDRWVWDLQGVERVPYRLPELLADAAAPVVIVEGERDVEAVRALGLVATCNPGGAGKWPLDFGRHLKGRRVAIIPDNDPPGELHAAQVLGSLVLWNAASVRVVRLPGLPEGGDVSDWLADGAPGRPAGREALRRSLCDLVRAAPEWRRGAAWSRPGD